MMTLNILVLQTELLHHRLTILVLHRPLLQRGQTVMLHCVEYFGPVSL